MRSILLVGATLLLTVGVFVTYRMFQPRPLRVPGGASSGVRPVEMHPSAPRVGHAAQGDRPWIRNIDRLGRLASQFKADEYQPRGGGHVHVVQPRAEFFQYSGGKVQKVAIEGETGDFEVQQPADSSNAFDKGSAGAPKRGRIKRGANPVTVRLYPDMIAQKDHVSITLTTDNLSFDNETFEISTAAITDAAGNEIVPADQVPIHVEGDYDFDGRGLTLGWNDLDGRLEHLEIAHGDHLTILHPSGMTSSFGGASEQKKTAPPTTPPGSAQLVSYNQGDTANAPAAAPIAPAAPEGPSVTAPVAIPPAARKSDAAKLGKHGPPPPYLATFERNIRITQGTRGGDEKQLATADRMSVDFLLNQSKPTTQPVTQPASGSAGTLAPTLPATRPALADAGRPSAAVGDQPGGIDASGAAPTTMPATNPSTQPATRPADTTEPVNVYWVGKLVVVPNSKLSTAALQPGQSIVHLLGDEAPVHVTRDANDVVCAALDYLSPEGNVALYHSETFPQVVVRQLAAAAPIDQSDPESVPPDDAVITTESIDYSGVDHVAILHGNSEARVQLKDDSSAPGGPSKPGELDIRWDRLAKIYFINHAIAAPVGSQAKSTQQQLAVDHAHLEGDVDLRHPQLALKSQMLDASFATAPAAVAVRVPSPGTPGDGVRAAGSSPSTRPLAAPKEQTVLRHIVATDAVSCAMTDEAGKKQNVECHQLTMDTAISPVGKMYPKVIDFYGDALADAHAYDPTQDMHAGHINLTFVPTTGPSKVVASVSGRAAQETQPSPLGASQVSYVAAPAPGTSTVRDAASGKSRGPTTQPTTRPVELDTMTATDRVRIKTTEGASASAERLYVQMVEGQPHATLTGKPGAAPGSPESLATVIDAKKNVIIGPTIVSDPKQNIATVQGPGSLHLIRQDTLADKPRPIDVAFLGQAVMDSPDNIIDITDHVAVVSPDPDGTINTSNCRHVRITLADKPPQPTPPPGTTRPSTGGASMTPSTNPSTHPSTRPAGLASGPQDVMKGKVVTGLVLEHDAVIKSTLTDAKGAILRQFDLKADLIRYVLASTAPGAKGTIIVPVPGQMLIRDHRPPTATTAPAAGRTPAPTTAPVVNAGDPGNSRGATAFQWAKQLTYDETTQTAVFTGDVLIVHQEDDSKEEPARLRADKVVAVFEPRPNPAAKPHAPPPGSGAAPEPASQMQLKSMTATGSVVVTRGGSELDAPRMDYNPVTGWMTAVGTDREPATYLDATGTNSATARQIDWNAQTWNVKLKDIISRTGRR